MIRGVLPIAVLLGVWGAQIALVGVGYTALATIKAAEMGMKKVD